MERVNREYIPEICARLIRDGIESGIYYKLAEKGLGVITQEEAEESFNCWRERLERFYENVGWNSKLVGKIIQLS